MAIKYRCNEAFTYKGKSYQEHEIFDGAGWHKKDLEAALKTNLISKEKLEDEQIVRS